MFKNSVYIFVEKIYKMGCLEGSDVPVPYIERTVLKGSVEEEDMSKEHEMDRRDGEERIWRGS
jgi:hypothetical protein